MSAAEQEPLDVETEARALGWVPKEEFRGDESRWVDAAEFVENGHKVLPIVRANNKRLIEQQQALSRQVQELTEKLAARDQDFDTLQEFHNTELERRTKEIKAQLRAGIKQAREDGDVDRELELQEELGQVTQAAEPADDEPAQQPSFQKTPMQLAWEAKNPWMDKDPVRTHAAMAHAYAIKAENPDLVGQAFYDELDRRLTSANEPSKPRVSKVEGSRGGSTGGASNGRSYADLGKDERAACDKWAKQFVKPGGKFPTVDAYRKHYVAQLEAQGYWS